MSGQTVTIRKMLPASCEEVLDAWLNLRGDASMDVSRARDELRGDAGTTAWAEHFRIVMTAPNTEYFNTGEFRVLDRPSKLEFTWVSSRWGHQETLVTVELHKRETHCELVLTHRAIPSQTLCTGT